MTNFLDNDYSFAIIEYKTILNHLTENKHIAKIK